MDARDWLIAIGSFVLFALLIKSPLFSIGKLILVVVIMLLVSRYFAEKFHLESYYGLLLVKGKAGISYIRKLSKTLGHYQDILSDVALAMTFGLSSMLLMDWLPLKKRLFTLAIAFEMLFLLALIYPLATDYVSIYFPKLSSSKPSLQPAFLALLTSLGGLMSLVAFFTYYAAAHTLFQLYMLLTSGSAVIHQSITLVLPGVNIPLFEGILALALILIIHEGGHAILTVRNRVPLLNTGLVFFGSLPVGAFVEPDEKRLFSKPRRALSRVLAAGPGFNLFAATLFGMLFLFFLNFASPFSQHGCLVLSGQLPKGTVITNIEGYSCYARLPPNTTVNVSLSNGSTLSLRTNDEGYLPLEGQPLGFGAIQRYTNPLLDFVYNFLGLLFSLNLFIGIINLLPVPLFDGDHLLRAAIGESYLYKFVKYSLLIAFLLLFLPGLF